jgi:uncharacterized protein YjbI with pentapeptide repeats
VQSNPPRPHPHRWLFTLLRFIAVVILAGVGARLIGHVNSLLIVIWAVIAMGLFLWWPLRSDKKERGILGASLVTGAVIALAFFYLQNQHEEALKTAADQQAKVQRGIADQQTLRITVGLQRDLSGAELEGKYLSFVNLAGKDLSRADLREAKLERAGIVGVRLRNARLDRTNLIRADLTRADLQGAVLSGADLEKAKLGEARLRDAIVGEGIRGHTAYLVGASLTNADLRGACLAGADLARADLSGADFSGAVLTNADLREAELERDGVPVNLKRAWTAGIKIDPSNRRFISTSPAVARTRGARSLDSHARSGAILDRVVSTPTGDTIELRRLGWVRLIGLSAPSRKDPMWVQAHDFLTREVPVNSSVRYELGPQRRELLPRAIGRWRAYIWLRGGRFLNESILEGGYVKRQTKPPERHDYAAVLEEAEQRAKASGRGVWTSCRKE